MFADQQLRCFEILSNHSIFIGAELFKKEKKRDKVIGKGTGFGITLFANNKEKLLK